LVRKRPKPFSDYHNFNTHPPPILHRVGCFQRGAGLLQVLQLLQIRISEYKVIDEKGNELKLTSYNQIAVLLDFIKKNCNKKKKKKKKKKKLVFIPAYNG